MPKKRLLPRMCDTLKGRVAPLKSTDISDSKFIDVSTLPRPQRKSHLHNVPKALIHGPILALPCGKAFRPVLTQTTGPVADWGTLHQEPDILSSTSVVPPSPHPDISMSGVHDCSSLEMSMNSPHGLKFGVDLLVGNDRFESCHLRRKEMQLKQWQVDVLPNLVSTFMCWQCRWQSGTSDSFHAINPRLPCEHRQIKLTVTCLYWDRTYGLHLSILCY